MKFIKTYLIPALILPLIFISCSSESKSGGDCTYTSYEGYAVIKSITPAPASEYNCPDKPQKIIFEFTPLDLSVRQKYRFTNFSDTAVSMRINDGANPSIAWVKKNKIEPGKKFRCFRTELTDGTCTPVVFKFPELDLFPETGCM